MGYQIWISYDNDEQRIMLPVLPERVQAKCGSQDSSVSIADLGEITVKQGRPAYMVSFTSFFPEIATQGGGKLTMTPTAYRDKILEWKDGTKPCHLVITGTGVNMSCTISDFQWYEQGGDIGTIHYSITFKEYREVSTRQITIESATGVATASAAETRTDDRVVPQTYTVKTGDSLCSIARRLLGNEQRYIEIYNLNTDKIKPSMIIYTGQVLRLPTGASSTNTATTTKTTSIRSTTSKSTSPSGGKDNTTALPI